MRAQQRRCDASTLYRRDGTLCTSTADVGDELPSKWAPVFQARPADADAMNKFLPCAQHAIGDQVWAWRRGTLREVASRARDSTPGMDGLGYSFWASTPGCCLEVLDDIADGAQHSTPLPRALHTSRTVFIPEAELLADPGNIIPTGDTTRPSTMITTGETLLALRVNDELAPIAARTVAHLRRHRRTGRRHGVLFTAFWIPRGRCVIRLRQRISCTFPSLDLCGSVCHAHPAKPINLIKLLYADLSIELHCAGVTVASTDLCSGIPQGCPLSGTVFALALDPCIR